jgi:serine/threonine-protein kinase RsbW
MPYFNKLTVPGYLADLPAILAFVEHTCEQAGVDPALHFDLQLAVEEACRNVIEHAYEGKGGEFSVMFETRGRDVVITLRDCGRPFDPAQVVEPDMHRPLAERRIGGLGMHLMYQLMDDVQFTFSEAGNTLVMVKRSAVHDDVLGAPTGGAMTDAGALDRPGL